MFPLGLLIFIVLPIAELYVIIQVGYAIGIVPTLALLILDSFIGLALLRSQGRTTWARFNQTLAAGRVPGREIFDGAMIILGGAFLLTPGFITDIFGIVLLLPPTRALVRRGAVRLAARRMPIGWTMVGSFGRGPSGSPGQPRTGPRQGAAGRPRASREYDVEGTATEIRDAPELDGGEENGRA